MILISLQTTQLTSEGEQSPRKLKWIGANWLRLPKESLSRLGLLQRATSKLLPPSPDNRADFTHDSSEWRDVKPLCSSIFHGGLFCTMQRTPFGHFSEKKVRSFTGAPSPRLQRPLMPSPLWWPRVGTGALPKPKCYRNLCEVSLVMSQGLWSNWII